MILFIFINLTIFLSIAAVILHFSDSDPKWERWCGQTLIFAIIPVIVIPGVNVLRIPIAPIYIIGLIWGLIIFIYLKTKSNKNTHEEVEMREKGYWKCSKCNEYNPKLSLICWKCSNKQDQS